MAQTGSSGYSDRVTSVVLTAWMLAFAATPAAAHGTGDASALVHRLASLSGGPSRPALDAALAAYADATRHAAVARANLLTVIDYTRPSTEPRLWVLDLDSGRVLYRELVAHGRRSGDNTTRAFSNAPGSLMTSLGLFVTDAAYVGRNGYSLRLRFHAALGVPGGLLVGRRRPEPVGAPRF